MGAESVRDRIEGLRTQAKRLREYAEYADGQDYYRERRAADEADAEANRLERELANANLNGDTDGQPAPTD